MPGTDFSTIEPEVRTCAHCGAVETEGATPVEVDGNWYCSEDCARWEGYERCYSCGEWGLADDGYFLGDEFYCSASCAERDGYHECYHCGTWVHVEDEIEVDGYHFCRPECAEEEDYRQCQRCGEWCHIDNTYPVNNEYGAEIWCVWCADYHASVCDDCHEYWDEDCITCDDDGNYHCPNCRDREDRTSYLMRYGYTPELVFYGDGGKTPYLGVEEETDGGRNRGGYCNALHAIGGFPSHFYMTEDGSLRNGVEITGHPMTLAYHMSIADMYEKIGETAIQFGYGSHNGGRCGLHIHVNRNFFGNSIAVQDAGGYRMMRLLQRFERQFMVFSRRTNTSWCSYRTCDDYTPKKTEVKIMPKELEPSMLTKSRRMKRETNHSQALNFQHSATFEFRIFRGTLKWSTYFAALALVNGMCHTAKKHGSIWVEDVDWYTFINEVVDNVDEPTAKQYLVDYLDEKGLR